jgi:hypothetical protein
VLWGTAVSKTAPAPVVAEGADTSLNSAVYAFYAFAGLAVAVCLLVCMIVALQKPDAPVHDETTADLPQPSPVTTAYSSPPAFAPARPTPAEPIDESVQPVPLTLLSGLAPELGNAQPSAFREAYGRGLTAFFDGDYVKAEEPLTWAIKAGTTDPRCYYFRGLIYRRNGRPQEAEADFREGARLERNGLGADLNVAESLERVQGVERAELERFRQSK